MVLHHGFRSWGVLRVLDVKLLPAEGEPLVLAVSGGADSLALWDLCAADGRWPLLIAHLDHGLRPEAQRDVILIGERLVRYREEFPDVAMALHAEIDDVAALAAAWCCGLEAAGRRRRHALYLTAATAHGARCVATAHHADDQAETLLHHHLRGADLAGQAGMPARRALGDGVDLVRPLLGCRREELRAHLHRRNLVWHEDASNLDPTFTRNRLRQQVLPVLEHGCPGFTAALLARGDRRRVERDDAITATAIDLERRLAGDGLDLVGWPADDAAANHLLRELCRRLDLGPGRQRIARLADLVARAPGRRCELGDRLFLRRDDRLTWEASRPGTDDGRVTLSVPGGTPRGAESIVAAWTDPPVDPHDAPREAHLAAEVIRGNLWWGPADPGSRWRPLGLGGTKSLRATLADRGIPSRARATFPVIGDNVGILWIPGHDLADRAKVTFTTTRVLHLRWEGGGDRMIGVTGSTG